MKKMLMLISPLFLTLQLFSQKAEVLFDKAIRFYEVENYDSALVIFERIYKKGKGDLEMIAKAHYNMGELYIRKKDTANAKKIFEDILDSDYDDEDKGGIGSGLMQEPYALYKHHCCTYLAEIALSEKKYNEALQYTTMFIEDYPYKHFCGNEYEANAIYSAYTLARCFEGLNQHEKSIGILLPKSMETGYAENKYLVDTLCKIIRGKYSTMEIENELNRAEMNIKEETTKGKYGYTKYSTEMFGTKIEIFNSFDYEKTKDLKDIGLYKYLFVHSYFYRSLMAFK